MSYKLLLALAACLPLALAGCGGGGGTPASSTAGPGGTQTPAQALAAAKNAVSNANSAKTAAAVEAARRALAAAVQTAETAVETAETGTTSAQAAVTKAQDYRTAQMAILDGLQPITAASLSLATVKTASTPAEAAAALTAAENAMTLATETRTAAAIEAARRALAAAARAAQAALEAARAALEAARAALEAAQAALELAREYRTEQLPAVNLIVTTQPEPPPSSPAAEFDVTHVDLSSVFILSPDGSSFKQQMNIPFDPAGWATLRDDAIAQTNGFAPFLTPSGLVDNDYTITSGTAPVMVVKSFPPQESAVPGILGWDRRVVAIGDYSAFDVVRSFTSITGTGSYGGGAAWAFGEPTNERPFQAPGVNRLARGSGDATWSGPAMVIDANGQLRGGDGNAGDAFPAHMTVILEYVSSPNRIAFVLSIPDRPLFTPQTATRVNIDSDGTFTGTSNSALSDGGFEYKGNFYGPNWEEVTGVFEGNNYYGAWLAKQARQTSGFVTLPGFSTDN